MTPKTPAVTIEQIHAESAESVAGELRRAKTKGLESPVILLKLVVTEAGQDQVEVSSWKADALAEALRDLCPDAADHLGAPPPDGRFHLVILHPDGVSVTDEPIPDL